MPKEETRLAISISELDKLLDLVEKLSTAVGKAMSIPKAERLEMSKAIEDTCALIDEVLRGVKKRLVEIQKQLKNNDPKAKDSIASLAYAEEWENMYRLFKLCKPLRDAASGLRENVLGRLIGAISFKNVNKLREETGIFFASEEEAANFVSSLLRDLTPLADKVSTDKSTVEKEIQKAVNSILSYQDRFIALQKNISEKV